MMFSVKINGAIGFISAPSYSIFQRGHLKKVKPKLAVIQNFSEKISNPIYHARKIQKETGVQTIAANDDMTIDLDSYSALNNQKTLGGF